LLLRLDLDKVRVELGGELRAGGVEVEK